jgi:hypothetical protein
VQRELTISKSQIEHALGETVRSFAYPYAFPQEDSRFVADLRHELKAQGYSAGVTTVVGRARNEDDHLTLPRLPVSDADDEQMFLAKLTGAYDWVGRAQWAVRHAKRILRRQPLGHND